MRGFGVGAEGESFHLGEEDGVFSRGFLCCFGEGGEKKGEEGGVEERETHFVVLGLLGLESSLPVQIRLRGDLRP